MRTLVYPPPGAHGFGRSRTVGVVARPLTTAAALAVLTELATGRHIRLAYAVDRRHVVHLYPQQQLSTADEVAAIAGFSAVTDARIDWHGAVA
jgi:hypothetical protein